MEAARSIAIALWPREVVRFMEAARSFAIALWPRQIVLQKVYPLHERHLILVDEPSFVLSDDSPGTLVHHVKDFDEVKALIKRITTYMVPQGVRPLFYAMQYGNVERELLGVDAQECQPFDYNYTITGCIDEAVLEEAYRVACFVARRLLEQDIATHDPHKRLPKTDSCAICLNDCPGLTYSLKCGHRFHVKCLHQWTCKHNTCPVCRQIVKFYVRSKMCLLRKCIKRKCVPYW